MKELATHNAGFQLAFDEDLEDYIWEDVVKSYFSENLDISSILYFDIFSMPDNPAFDNMGSL